MSWLPYPSTWLLIPMSRNPLHMGTWRLGPVTAHKCIGASAGFPLFVYPYMARTGGSYTFIVRPFRSYIYYDLGIAAVRACGKRNCYY